MRSEALERHPWLGSDEAVAQRARERFAAIDADIARTGAMPAPEGAEPGFSSEELAAARAGLARALAAARETA
ncbi:hypothetical protein JNW98_10000 [Streptomyces sp. SCA2-4]|nr:hypothetical protein [Streptomyces huiliensis]